MSALPAMLYQRYHRPIAAQWPKKDNTGTVDGAYIRVNKFLKFTTIKAHFNILLVNGEVMVNWGSRSMRMFRQFLLEGIRDFLIEAF